MSVPEKDAALEQLLEEMERQWTTDREIDEGLIDEGLRVAEGMPNLQLARAEVLLWAILDELEFERLDGAFRHGREIFDIALDLPSGETRKRLFIRWVRVERLLGEVPIEEGDELLAAAVSVLAEALEIPEDLEASPALRAESILERLRLRETVGRLDEALEESRLHHESFGLDAPGWLRGEFLADLACRELRAGNAAQAREILAEHRAGQETLGPVPRLAVAELVGFFGFYSKGSEADEQKISCQNAYGSVMSFLGMLRVGVGNSRRYGFELISLGTALHDVRSILRRVPETELVVEVRDFVDQFDEEGTIRAEELKEIQKNLVAAGPYRLSGVDEECTSNETTMKP